MRCLRIKDIVTCSCLYFGQKVHLCFNYPVCPVRLEKHQGLGENQEMNLGPMLPFSNDKLLVPVIVGFWPLHEYCLATWELWRSSLTTPTLGNSRFFCYHSRNPYASPLLREHQFLRFTSVIALFQFISRWNSKWGGNVGKVF